MNAIEAYAALVARVDRRCEEIRALYADHIACTKGCSGNCCRIHLSISAVEACHLAGALGAQPERRRRRIQKRALETGTSGPCPLLHEGACRMYAHRLLICRTHGLPMRSVYRGRISIGFCPKNFTRLSDMPPDACIDLDRLNAALAAVSQQFVAERSGLYRLKTRYLVGEALLAGLQAGLQDPPGLQ